MFIASLSSSRKNEVVEPFTDGGSVVHGPSEFRLAQVFEQIGAANDLPEFLEGVYFANPSIKQPEAASVLPLL
jgi:hypothetical protein